MRCWRPHCFIFRHIFEVVRPVYNPAEMQMNKDELLASRTRETLPVTDQSELVGVALPPPYSYESGCKTPGGICLCSMWVEDTSPIVPC
jgi:hypothetical protein